MKKLAIIVFALAFSTFSFSQNMEWILVEELPATLQEQATQQSDCSGETNVFCYALVHTSSMTKLMKSYTTFFRIDCAEDNQQSVVYNGSQIMVDNSTVSQSCGNIEQRFNASAHTGNRTLEAGESYLLHEICFQVDDAAELKIEIRQPPHQMVQSNASLGNQGDECTIHLAVEDLVINANEVCNRLEGNIFGSIDGQTLTNHDVELSLIDYIISTNDGPIEIINSGESSSYSFGTIPFYEDYDITANRPGDPLNGLSTFDIVQIQKHLLGKEYFDSPWKYIAADANGSESVTALDMIELRSLLLGKTTEFSNNQPWIIIPANQEFQDPTHPWPFEEKLRISDFSQNQSIDNDFVAIKVGDINGNANVDGVLQVEDRDEDGVLILALEDQRVQQNQLVRVPVFSSNFDEVLGFQFTLEFDSELLQFVSLESASLDVSVESNLSITELKSGLTSMSWSLGEGVSITKNEELFTLNFKALGDGQLNESIELSNALLSREAYTANSDAYGVELAWRTNGAGNQEIVGNWGISQNHPNPFTESTKVPFYVPETSNITFQVFNSLGEVAILKSDIYEQGNHEFFLKNSDLNAAGVWYFEMNAKSIDGLREFNKSINILLIN